MIFKTFFTRFAVFCTLLLVVTACQPSPVPLNDADAQAFDAEVDEIVTNMITGLSNNNWTQYTRDFDTVLLNASDQTTGFPQVYNGVIGITGPYQSRTLTRVEDLAESRSVIYDATFEDDPHVVMRVVFTISDAEHKISGVWFDSAKLRGK